MLFRSQVTYTFPDGRKYVGEWKDGKQISRERVSLKSFQDICEKNMPPLAFRGRLATADVCACMYRNLDEADRADFFDERASINSNRVDSLGRLFLMENCAREVSRQ